MAISKNLKEVLKYLGEPYTVKRIDLEDCIYRRINDRFDIEVSGCNKKRSPFYVYVWDISNGTGLGAKIVEQSGPIRDLPKLKSTLESYVTKYSS